MRDQFNFRKERFRAHKSLFESAVRFRILEIGGDAPKSRRWHNKLDSDLGLTHEAVSQICDAAEEFLSATWILNANDLIDVDVSREKYQGSVVIYYYCFRFFQHGALAGVAQTNGDRNPGLDALTAATILRSWVERGSDSHGNNLATLRRILKFQGRFVPSEILHENFDLQERRVPDFTPFRGQRESHSLRSHPREGLCCVAR
jgi:hypothetical protein